MSRFQPTLRPDHCPWGGIDHAEQVHSGIWRVSTPGHGGFILSDEHQAAMPASLALDDVNYEEDVDYALVVLAFAAEFEKAGTAGTQLVRNAHDTVRNWHPNRYASFIGRPIEARDSHVLALRDAYRARIGRAVVVAAFGDWAEWVPPGKTGVVARTLIGCDQLARPIYGSDDHRALVDADRYAARGSVVALDELDAVAC